jgi:DNA-binding protein YbaB
MERNTVDLNDPIAKKLDDNATLERLVRQAVSDAVDKARKLGFLDKQNTPIKQSDDDRPV